jgi:hypothetical protein
VVSLEHEGPIWLLRLWPTLIVDLLTPLLADKGLALPAFDAAEIASEEATTPVPVERRADFVLSLKRGEATVLTLVVEVQLRPDDDTRHRLPDSA